MSGEDFVGSMSDLDIVLAHWHVNGWGGAEYLVTRLAEVLNIDRIYTVGPPATDEPNPYGDVSFYNVTSDLSFPRLRRVQSQFGRLFEYALWEDVDWRMYDTPDVLVTSGATTRAVIAPDKTLHVNYCHSPPRWFYDQYHDRKDSPVGLLARPILRYLRTRDSTIDARVDHYLSNSPVIKRRLWKYYNRQADVLYPPIKIDRYYNAGDDGFYLHLGRLDREKGALAVIKAFEGIPQQLVFAGSQGDVAEAAIERIQDASNMEYEGFVSEGRKRDLLANCRAVVFNGYDEDFGIVPIEANASGKPCLTRNDGFPGLFIEDGQNGFLHNGQPASIQEATTRCERTGIDADPTTYVAEFSFDTFADRLTCFLKRKYIQFTKEHLRIESRFN